MMLPRIEASWLSGGPLPRLLQVLDGDGEEARVVGGAVRNALLGEPIAEIDVATTARPDEMMRRVTAAKFKAVPTGIEHGTVTVIVDGAPFEVTTLRHDVETDGRHAKVAFGRDWKADAERRDFTMNALSAARDGVVHDYVGGLEDLAARRVRFIGEPRRRIEEDYLRILRFFRFNAAYGEGVLDPEGLHACIVSRAGLAQLSRERVRMELVKLLVARRATPVLQVMADTGLLPTLLKGVPNVVHFATMTGLEAALSQRPDAMRRLAALTVLVVEDADRLHQVLRLSNDEHARLAAMAAGWRAFSPAMSGPTQHASLYRARDDFTAQVMLAWVRAGAPSNAQAWHALFELPRRWPVPVFPLKAADLMARGVEKGARLGVALKAAEQAWIEADFPSAPAKIAAIADAAARR
ncbi:MAG: CCA tRNA nucleotidyltransferase [Pseudolabrys sp.]|jgi:poly(A) polymerase|nr:CCA tRNA nucleotidyltransferase [Pseudolabrys sp.]